MPSRDRGIDRIIDAHFFSIVFFVLSIFVHAIQAVTWQFYVSGIMKLFNGPAPSALNGGNGHDIIKTSSYQMSPIELSSLATWVRVP